MPTRLFRQLPGPPVTHEARFGLMGETLVVQSDSQLVIDAAEAAFGPFARSDDGRPPLVLRLFVDRPARGGEARPSGETRAGVERQPGPASAVGPWPAPRYLADAHLLIVDLGPDGSAVADLVAGHAAGRVSAALAADAPYLRITVVEAMGLSLLQARGYLAVHASCVIHDGISLTVQAAAGTGKSTLAYAAARRGFGFLAEDVVFVRPARDAADGAPPELWGSPWRLHLLPDAPTLFPELAGLDSHRQLNGEMKLEVDIAARFPGVARTHAPAGPQLLLSRGPARGDPIERLDVAEAASLFEVLWPWDLPWDVGREATAAALRAQGVYRVHVAGTPDEAVDLLQEVIRRVAAGPA